MISHYDTDRKKIMCVQYSIVQKLKPPLLAADEFPRSAAAKEATRRDPTLS
jgi:hypothetical protein